MSTDIILINTTAKSIVEIITKSNSKWIRISTLKKEIKRIDIKTLKKELKKLETKNVIVIGKEFTTNSEIITTTTKYKKQTPILARILDGARGYIAR